MQFLSLWGKRARSDPEMGGGLVSCDVNRPQQRKASKQRLRVGTSLSLLHSSLKYGVCVSLRVTKGRETAEEKTKERGWRRGYGRKGRQEDRPCRDHNGSLGPACLPGETAEKRTQRHVPPTGQRKRRVSGLPRCHGCVRPQGPAFSAATGDNHITQTVLRALLRHKLAHTSKRLHHVGLAAVRVSGERSLVPRRRA